MKQILLNSNSDNNAKRANKTFLPNILLTGYKSNKRTSAKTDLDQNLIQNNARSEYVSTKLVKKPAIKNIKCETYKNKVNFKDFNRIQFY